MFKSDLLKKKKRRVRRCANRCARRSVSAAPETAYLLPSLGADGVVGGL